MIKIFILACALLFIHAETNSSQDNNSSTTSKNDTNITSKQEKIDKQLEVQIAREKKFAKEKIFYQGADYNLSEHQVDIKALESIPLIEPDYDFNMGLGSKKYYRLCTISPNLLKSLYLLSFSKYEGFDTLDI